MAHPTAPTDCWTVVGVVGASRTVGPLGVLGPPHVLALGAGRLHWAWDEPHAARHFAKSLWVPVIAVPADMRGS